VNTCNEDVASFLLRERKTLEYLAGKTNCPHLSHIVSSANTSRYNILPTGFSSYLKWTVAHDELNAVYDIHVGGSGSCKGNILESVSYFFTITEEKDGAHRVLRKFHFDYTCPANERRRPQPLFHLQFPGELPSWMEDDYKTDHLDPKLSEPRILYFPMSLSLVLHIAFTEFRDQYTDKIIKDGGWLGLVKTDQEMLWKPYMETCLDHISKNRIILDEAYAT
jgi:hypothetical protein